MSKGSTPRPLSVSNEEYSQRWDAIFAKPELAICDELATKPPELATEPLFFGDYDPEDDLK